MGNKNRKVWKKLGVRIQKGGVPVNSFPYKDGIIFVFLDVCHILKNLKHCCLQEKIIICLPKDYCRDVGLPSNIVVGKYVRDLWNQEVLKNQDLRLLHHLN